MYYNYEIMTNLFAIVKNNKIIEYPVDPRIKFPNYSLHLDWNGGVIENVQFVVIKKIPHPNFHLSEKIIEDQPIFDKKTNLWTQQWKTEYIGSTQLKQIISEIRYNRETMGTLVDDCFFKTDRESQTKYAIMALNNVKTHWKTNYNFVDIDMKIVNEKISAYVKNCFETERKFYEIIDTDDLQLIKNTDFNSGWPSNGEGGIDPFKTQV